MIENVVFLSIEESNFHRFSAANWFFVLIQWTRDLCFEITDHDFMIS